MKDIGIDKREGTVVFGQVDGMGDQVSYGLGKYYNFKGYLYLIYPNELEIVALFQQLLRPQLSSA
jgi:hypothetical protein